MKKYILPEDLRNALLQYLAKHSIESAGALFSAVQQLGELAEQKND